MGRAEDGLVPGVRRIAVLKASALGDFVQSLPALKALERAYPDASITLLGRRLHDELLAGRPSPVDEVLVVPEGAIGDEPVGYRPTERERFLAALAGVRFDLAIQLHGGGRNSNSLLRALGARVTAGARTADALELDRSLPYDVYQSDLLRQLEIVALVGATHAELEPRLAVTPEDVDEARRVAHLAADRPLAVIHPGASDPRRRWPAERFAAVADALTGAGAHVVVTGIEAERPLVERVVEAAREPIKNLSGRLSLAGLVGLLAQAAVVVSNDTGTRHLAGAVGSATVGIYWVGNLLTAGPPTRRRHRAFISWRFGCPVCGRPHAAPRCPHDVSFVEDVPLEAVVEASLEVYAQALREREAWRREAPVGWGR